MVPVVLLNLLLRHHFSLSHHIAHQQSSNLLHHIVWGPKFFDWESESICDLGAAQVQNLLLKQRLSSVN